MRKRLALLSSLVVLVITLTSCKEHECPLPQIILSGESLPDAQVNSFDPAVLSGPGGAKLGATAWTYGGIFGAIRSFVNFDLSSVPANAEIVSAFITLNADTTNPPHGHSQLTGPNSWKIKRVTSAWGEYTTSWYSRPSYDNVNAVSMPASTGASQTYTADITRLVKDQFAHPTQYYGIMLQLDTESVYRGVFFCSREHPYASTLAPKVVIKYRMKE